MAKRDVLKRQQALRRAGDRVLVSNVFVGERRERLWRTVAAEGESSAIAAGAGPLESGHPRCRCFPEPFLLFVEVFLDQIGFVGLLHG